MCKTITVKNHTISSQKSIICVPVIKTTADEILSEIKQDIDAGAEFIEFRADFFKDLTEKDKLLDLLKKIEILCKDTIILFTIRSKNEGGQIQIEENELISLLEFVSATGCVDFIDVEIDGYKNSAALISHIQKNGTYVIASNHNFSSTYNEDQIISIFEKMYNAKADIQKIAMMPQNKMDVLNTLRALSAFYDKYQDALAVAISMGEYGKASRVCGGLFGSCMTFAAMKDASAPGQVAFDDMKALLRVLEK